MRHFKNAVKLDLDKKYNEAIDVYETALQEDKPDVDVYINVSFLYWLSASEFAWADAYKIFREVRGKAVARYTEILNEAKLRFSECAELYFLEKYFWHRLVFNPFTEIDVIKILSEKSCCKEVPYFFLYLFDNKKYWRERDILLKKCIELPTWVR